MSFAIGDKIKMRANKSVPDAMPQSFGMISKDIIYTVRAFDDQGDPLLEELPDAKFAFSALRFEKVQPESITITKFENSAGEMIDYPASAPTKYAPIYIDEGNSIDNVHDILVNRRIESHKSAYPENPLLQLLKEHESAAPKEESWQIIQFKSLAELVKEFPTLTFSIANTLYIPNTDCLEFRRPYALGEEHMLSDSQLLNIPSWVIKKNLGR